MNHFQKVMERSTFPSSERDLQLKLIMNPHSTYTELIEWEWEVFDNQAHLGKGDLVFKNKDGAYLIVETKWINFGSGCFPLLISRLYESDETDSGTEDGEGSGVGVCKGLEDAISGG
jgi:hypothetical protein